MSLGKVLKNFTVLGPGGVGGLVAGLLARQGAEVTVVATERTAAHIRTEGVRIESALFGDFLARPAAVPALTAPTDVLIVAPKATSLAESLERVPARHTRGALVVPLLNGWEHMALLRGRYPDAHVLAAAIRVESTRVAPGRVSQTSPFALLDIAAPPELAGPAEALADVMRGTGLRTTTGADEADTLWRKFHFLLPTALVCTHVLGPIGVARTERRADLVGVMTEVETVGAAHGVTLDTADVLAKADAVPPGTKPSMLRDREAARPMEVDALGGAFLRAAHRVETEVPVTARIVADLERQG